MTIAIGNTYQSRAMLSFLLLQLLSLIDDFASMRASTHVALFSSLV